MFDFEKMSEEEKQLLEEVAKAKGQTLEEALIDLGHVLPPAQDEEVVLGGDALDTAPDTPEEAVAVAEPIEVTEEAPEHLEEALTHEPEPMIEPPPPPEAVEEPEEAEEEYSDESPMSPIKQICVQCGWDQEVPTIPEPEHADKISFLQSILGHKVFNKRYSMFGGNLRVTFRSLSIREIDVLYQEAFLAQKDGMIETAADYYEYLNRLRLHLQLIAFSAKGSTLHLKLPEGLNKETHPEASNHWDAFLKEKNLYKEDVSLLRQVQDYVISEVLKTEHLQRTITHECAKFNRLVAKLEACVDDANFWKETVLPS